MAKEKNVADKEVIQQAPEVITEVTPEVVAEAEATSALRQVEYITTPYSPELQVGTGAYIRVVAGNETPKTCSSIGSTTEPVIEITETGFKTTDTEYICVDSVV